VPIEFLEIELATLEPDGAAYDHAGVPAANGQTRLVDLTTTPGPLKAPIDKIHPDAVPGPQHRQPAVLRAHRRDAPRARR
jgi:UDP-N-acetylglucosamine 1-carboxyvinyltransferase